MHDVTSFINVARPLIQSSISSTTEEGDMIPFLLPVESAYPNGVRSAGEEPPASFYVGVLRGLELLDEEFVVFPTNIEGRIDLCMCSWSTYIKVRSAKTVDLQLTVCFDVATYEILLILDNIFCLMEDKA